MLKWKRNGLESKELGKQLSLSPLEIFSLAGHRGGDSKAAASPHFLAKSFAVLSSHTHTAGGACLKGKAQKFVSKIVL